MRNKWKDFINWLDWNFPIIFIVLIVVIGIIYIIALIANYNLSAGDFNTAQWVANPANPASPLH